MKIVRSHSLSILAICWAASGVMVEAATPKFTNVTASAGLNYVQYPGNAPGPGLFRTGGAAAGDYDNDGWVDLFVTRLNARDILYRNQGDGTFVDVSVAAGFTASLLTNGAAWGDIENDGDLDLYVTSSGGSRFYLYVNDGGKFTEQANGRGAAVSGGMRYGQSATFGDYDGDGYLDIHTNDWGNDVGDNKSRLLRNLGSSQPGYFEDVTEAAGLNVFRPSLFQDGSTDTNGYRYSSTFTDLDADGHPDLAIAADFNTSQIFWNNGDGTFTDGTAAADVGTDEDGMGSAIGDFDADGKLDWFVSALVDVPGGFAPHSGNRLFHNNGDRTFTDVTDAAGVRNTGWSWGSSLFDYDNDRDLDLMVTNGWDTSQSDSTHLLQNSGGKFVDVSNDVGVVDAGMGRALVNFDYDNDGDLDTFIANHGGQPVLYRNDGGNDLDWLKIKVKGTQSNRDGIGTKIIVDPDSSVTGDELIREVQAGGTFLGQHDLTAHFGLGDLSGSIDRITVDWPSGLVQQLGNVPGLQTLLLTEGSLPGDYNHNDLVDPADFTLWRDQLGKIGDQLAADGNGDGRVTQADYEIWKQNFGAMWLRNAAAQPLSVSVPEPSTWTHSGMALTSWMLFRRRGAARRER